MHWADIFCGFIKYKIVIILDHHVHLVAKSNFL